MAAWIEHIFSRAKEKVRGVLFHQRIKREHMVSSMLKIRNGEQFLGKPRLEKRNQTKGNLTGEFPITLM